MFHSCVGLRGLNSLLPVEAHRSSAGFWAGLVVMRNASEDNAVDGVHTLHGFMSEVNGDILLAVS